MDDLKQRIIEVLMIAPAPLKAKAISKLLGEDDTKRINSILYSFISLATMGFINHFHNA